MKIQILLAAFLCSAMIVEPSGAAKKRQLLAADEARKKATLVREDQGDETQDRGSLPPPVHRAMPARAAVCLPVEVQAAIDADPEGAAAAAVLALQGLPQGASSNRTVAGYLS